MPNLYFIKDIKKSNSSCDLFEGKKKYIATADLQNGEIVNYELVNFDNKPSRANLIAEIGSVIFAKMQNTIKVLEINEKNVDNIYSTGFYSFKDERILPSYLKFFFESTLFNAVKDKNCQGATMKAINDEGMSKISINVPTIQIQEQIIIELSKITELINFNKNNLINLDNIVKSQFIEMFGNLENTVTVKDCCKVHSRIGWQSLTKNEHQKDGYSLLITGTDLVDKRINYDTCVYVTKERYDMDTKIQLKNDDILITKDGTIGKVAIVDNLHMPATLNSGLFVVRPDERFDKHYISYVFKSDFFNDFVESVKTGATIKHLNQEALFKFEIPVPSIEQQNKFANFVQQIDKSKLNRCFLCF